MHIIRGTEFRSKQQTKQNTKKEVKVDENSKIKNKKTTQNINHKAYCRQGNVKCPTESFSPNVLLTQDKGMTPN